MKTWTWMLLAREDVVAPYPDDDAAADVRRVASDVLQRHGVEIRADELRRLVDDGRRPSTSDSLTHVVRWVHFMRDEVQFYCGRATKIGFVELEQRQVSDSRANANLCRSCLAGCEGARGSV